MENSSLSLDELQSQVGAWATKNFGDRPAWQQILGAAEEVGELSHSYLKKAQGIRGTPEEHDANMKDAVADIIIYLADFCAVNGWSLQDIVENTWYQVRRRDWKADPTSGGGVF